MICEAGGEAALVDFISTTKGVVRLPGIMTLGYIASFDEMLAMGIINAKGIQPLKHALVYEEENHIKASAAWTLGQIGGHSVSHSKAMAENDVPSHLLAVYKY